MSGDKDTARSDSPRRVERKYGIGFRPGLSRRGDMPQKRITLNRDEMIDRCAMGPPISSILTATALTMFNPHLLDLAVIDRRIE